MTQAKSPPRAGRARTGPGWVPTRISTLVVAAPGRRGGGLAADQHSLLQRHSPAALAAGGDAGRAGRAGGVRARSTPGRRIERKPGREPVNPLDGRPFRGAGQGIGAGRGHLRGVLRRARPAGSSWRPPGPPSTTVPAAGRRAARLAGPGRCRAVAGALLPGAGTPATTSASRTHGRAAPASAEQGVTPGCGRGYGACDRRARAAPGSSARRTGDGRPLGRRRMGYEEAGRDRSAEPSSGVPAAVLENVFDDPTHGEPGRDRIGVHLGWELLLLAGLAALGWLLWQEDSAALRGDNLRHAAGRRGRAGAARPGCRAEPADGGTEPGRRADRARRRPALRRAGRSGPAGVGRPGRGRRRAGSGWRWRWSWWCCTCPVGLPAWPALPAWWCTSNGASAPVLVQGDYDPARQRRRTSSPASPRWPSSAGCSAPTRAVRRLVGRYRPIADPARRRGGLAAVVTAVALVGSSVLRRPRRRAARRQRPRSGRAHLGPGLDGAGGRRGHARWHQRVRPPGRGVRHGAGGRRWSPSSRRTRRSVAGR